MPQPSPLGVVHLEVRISRSVFGFPRPNLRLLTAVVVLAASLATTGALFGASPNAIPPPAQLAPSGDSFAARVDFGAPQANTPDLFTVPGPGVINPSAPPPPPPTPPPTYTPPPTSAPPPIVNPSAPPPPTYDPNAPLTLEEEWAMYEWWVLYMAPYGNP